MVVCAELYLGVPGQAGVTLGRFPVAAVRLTLPQSPSIYHPGTKDFTVYKRLQLYYTFVFSAHIQVLVKDLSRPFFAFSDFALNHAEPCTYYTVCTVPSTPGFA